MNYYCESCGKLVTRHYGSGRFCSNECARKRPQTEETKQKISKANKGRAPTGGSFKAGHRPVGDRKIAAKKVSLTWKIKKENRAYNELNIKEKVLFDQDNRCNCCGINEWRGRPITLELHHKDGNHENNCRENLEYLCPNCHSQTENWRKSHKKS